MVNTAIYGDANNWRDCLWNDKFYTNKKAFFAENQSQLRQGVTADKLSYDTPIDKSLSYCGLGAECALSHVRYIGKDNGDIVQLDSNDRFVTNFAFFEITQNTGRSGAYNYGLTDMLDNRAWQENTDDTDLYWSTNKNKILEPITLLHPKSMVLLITVSAYDNDNNHISATLDEYKQLASTYNKLAKVYVSPYLNIQLSYSIDQPTRDVFGVNGNKSFNYKSGYNIGLLDDYTINSKNFKMQSYFMTSSGERVVMGVINEYQQRAFSDTISVCYVPENVGDHLKYELKTINNNDYQYCYIEYYEGLIEEIYKTVACFGLYFTDKQAVAERGTFINADMYIGLLDSDGIGHGQYLRGADTVNAPQNNYDDMSQSGYDYTKIVDTTDYVNNTRFNTLDLNFNCINKFFVVTQAQIEQLSTELYSIVNDISPDEPIERYNQMVFLTQNPIDCIVSIKRYPVDCPAGDIAEPLKLGSKTTNITAYPLIKPCEVYYFSFKNSSNTGLFKTYGGSFLDYEPFTKVMINVPFCGSFDVPCNYFHRYGGVDIALLIDFVTGACSAFLIVNGDVVDSLQGECGVNVPLSGIQASTIDSQIYNAALSKQKQDSNFALSMLGGAAAIAIGVATGGAAAVLGGAAALASGAINKFSNDKSIDYNLQHMQAPIKQVSSASSVLGRANDMRCKMVISRPLLMEGYNEEIYAETVGFACLLNGVVSDFHGLTCGTIELSGVPCTAEEKVFITNAFASGIHL